jgi:peptide/nickel transport system permease protein
MNWWQKLRRNKLATFGAALLICFYIIAIAADFIAPYLPNSSQADGSLLPPTEIVWFDNQGQFGPFVYPAEQGKTDVATGERKLKLNRNKPEKIKFFVQGQPYNFLQLRLPTPNWEKVTLRDKKTKKAEVTTQLRWKDTPIVPGITSKLHLFGAAGNARINLLGTDEQARDNFSRILHGSRISLSIGLIGIAISFPIGMIVGGISGYFGGWVDALLMRLVEVLMSIPKIYLLVALSGYLLVVQGLSNSARFALIILITSFVGWAGLARVIRGQVLSIKEQEFIQAAKAMGAPRLYTIVRHILPQTATYAIVSATLAIPGYIEAESVLSLIGLGIQQPDASWGNLLSSATNASILLLQPWLIWPPAILIILTVLAFNLLGDGLRDALDPRSLAEEDTTSSRRKSNKLRAIASTTAIGKV